MCVTTNFVYNLYYLLDEHGWEKRENHGLKELAVFMYRIQNYFKNTWHGHARFVYFK